MCEVATSTRLIDDQEEDCVQEFAHRGCTCDKGPNKSHCCLLFSAEHYHSMRATVAELSHDELDLLVMGQIMAHTFQSPRLLGHHTFTPADRKTTYGHFYHQGQRVCQDTFLFLHRISLKRFKNIKASYLATGPVPRVHGNKCRKPRHHLTFEQIKDVIQYILTYTGKKNTNKKKQNEVYLYL